MPARTGRKHRRGTEAKRLEVAAHLVAELDDEGKHSGGRPDGDSSARVVG